MSTAVSESLRHISLMPSVLLVAQHDRMSISEFVDLLQSYGFGGKRGCRKLVHRLERLGLVAVGPGARGDRREKSVAPTLAARQLLQTIDELLDRILRN